jgi:two-component system sensor histidine kinase HydH
MKNTPPPAGFEDIQREELSRLFGRISHVRLAIVPVLIVLVAWLFRNPVTPWRRDVLMVLGVLATLVFVREVARHRRRGLGRRAFALNLGFAAVAQAVAALATGGLESPFLFAMFPLAMVTAAVVEPPLLYVVIGVQATELWGMAWVQHAHVLPSFMPGLFGGDLRGSWNGAHILWTAIFGTCGLAVVAFLGRGMRHSFDFMLRRGLQAREEALRAHAERAQELAALSGELAHELKNPLASIKGLSALLAHDAPPGKASERLTVLRAEVDRMQAIVEDFLNFSRPLAPLVVEDVDVLALVSEVAAMHEGMASEREVELHVTGEENVVRCDPRKVKQALINVVQNAIEASPPERAVELDVSGAAEVCVRVMDRGPGVDSALGDRVFEPGVTSKPKGSGLGLTIARSLLRQHGGELTLMPRDGGGTQAVLRFPPETPR